VYYRLLRAAIELDPERGAQRFTAFAGELTEAYTIELARRSWRPSITSQGSNRARRPSTAHAPAGASIHHLPVHERERPTRRAA
jgi:hypothetical protein